jgi:hypothetical protein
MGVWDLHALKRLEVLSQRMNAIGFTDLVSLSTADAWRANRERYEPEDLYDDPFTLGVLTSRNLSNRLFAEVSREQERWSSVGLTATRESSTTVLRMDGVEFRFVKVPHRMTRDPDFDSAFGWDRSELRLNAATRNQSVYDPPSSAALFEIGDMDPARAVQKCRDVFIVWGADLKSGLTGGWLGLPTIRSAGSPWLAVTQLWWDAEAVADGQSAAIVATDSEVNDFRSQSIPVPTLRLKSQRVTGSGQ